jgi:hypothetical protein
MNQFRNFDAPTAAQAVTITFERVTLPDETAGRPDEMDEGFWPSRDPNAAGYVLPENFDAEQARAQARMKAFDAGEWEYVGVIARAHIAVPIGGGSFTTFQVESAGLWGVESDAGEYLDSVFKEEKAALVRQLKALGRHMLEAFPDA